MRWKPEGRLGRMGRTISAGLCFGLIALAGLTCVVNARLVELAVPADESGNAPTLAPAAVDNDPDADSLLNRAHEYIGQGQYREALLLLQHVADNYGESMTEGRGGVFIPARRAVEQVIANLPPQGLDTYRLNVDGLAKGLVGGDVYRCRDHRALQQVVDKYFISSIGDDAAYVLACWKMDQGEPAAACELLRRVSRDHPDASVDRKGLYARLAVAAARSRSRATSREALDRLARLPGVKPELLADTKAMVDAVAPLDEAAQPGRWTHAWGSPDRSGVMPTLRHGNFRHERDTLAMLWRYETPIRSKQRYWGGLYFNPNRNGQSRPAMIDRWQQNRWLPSTKVQFVDGRIYYKTPDTLVCRDAQTGERLWRWQQEVARTHRHYGGGGSTSGQPTTVEEMLMFADQVGKSLSIVDGVVFHIAHHQDSAWPEQYERQNANRRRQPLVRGNALVALDATTGKPLWQRGRSGRIDDSLNMVRFLAPPVPGPGDTVMTVVDREGELSFIAFSRDTGQIVWDRFICAQGATSPPWAPVAINVSNDEAYILPGCGVVASADVYTGRINWVARYARSSSKQRNHHHNQRHRLSERYLGIRGWRENALFVRGGVVSAAPWDAEVLLLLDRQTGLPLHDPRSGERVGAVKVDQPRYCLGMIGDLLVYAQGEELVARDTQTAEVAWKAPAEGATGRAAITDDAIYLPTGEHVVQLDPARDGKIVAHVRCITPYGDPLGNLYCDGDRLMSVGLNQTYALVEGERYLADLDAQINGDASASAYLTRAKLKGQLNRYEAAIEDYRLAYRAAAKDDVRDRARRQLFEGMLAMAERDKANTARWLDETQKLLDELPVTDTLAERQRVLFARAEHLGGSGQVEQALTVYLRVIDEARRGKSETLLTMNDTHGKWSAQPRVFAVNAVDRFVEGDEPALAAMIDQRAAAALAEAQGRTGVAGRYQALGAVAFDYPQTASALAAIDAIGKYDEHVSFERMEQQLLRLSATRHARSASAAQAALADLFRQMDWPYEARDEWRRYSERFAELAVGDGAEPMTGGGLAEQRIAALAIDEPAPQYNRMPAPPWYKRWEVRGGYNSLALDLAGNNGGSQFLRSHVFVLYRNTSTLQCYRPDATSLTEDHVWKIALPRSVSNTANFYSSSPRFNGVVGGHVLVLRDTRRLLAYGLISGKKLWEIETEPANTTHQPQPFGVMHQTGNTDLTLGEGVLLRRVVTKDLFDRVAAHDAVTGELLWQRTFDHASVASVAVTGGYAVILIDNAKRALVCDRFTGRVLREIELDRYNRGQRIIWHNGHAIYYRSGNLVCIDLDTGDTAWQHPCQGNFQGLNSELIYFMDNRGNLVIRPMGPGDAVAQVERKTFGVSFNELAINPEGTELFALGYDNKGKYALSIVDLETGQRKQLIQFGQQQHPVFSASTLAKSGEFIPWVARHRHTGRVMIEFYRKSTGEKYTEHHLPTGQPEGRLQNHMPRAPQIVGNLLVISTNRGMTAYGAEAPKLADQAEKFDGTHTVRAGDSLFSIARKYYGDGNQWKRILEANKDTLESPDRLKVGQKLIIPPSEKKQGEGAAAGQPLRTSFRVSINAVNGKRSATITATGNVDPKAVVKQLKQLQVQGITDIKVEVETGDEAKDKAIMRQVDDMQKAADADAAKEAAVKADRAAQAAREAAIRAKLESVRRAAEAAEEPADE